MTETPWSEWLAIAARVFALKPAEFWALSLWEWRSLARSASTAHAAPSADELTAMMLQHPDERAGKIERTDQL